MDFSDDFCLRYFTQGQVERIMNSLRTFRSELINQNCNQSVDNIGALENIKISGGNRITISSSEEKLLGSTISVFNLNGKKIFQKKCEEEYFAFLDGSNYPFGIYILVLENENGYLARKILFQNISP
jgi:hypothetical protein